MALKHSEMDSCWGREEGIPMGRSESFFRPEKAILPDSWKMEDKRRTQPTEASRGPRKKYLGVERRTSVFCAIQSSLFHLKIRIYMDLFFVFL